MLSSTLTVLSLIFATLAPTPAVAQLNSTLSRRDPRPRPAAQGQHAPSSPKKPSRRRRSIPDSSSSSLTSEAALVKKRSKRRVNPKPRRVPLNPKFQKRSETPQTSYSLAQSSMGGYSFFDNWDWFTWADPTHGAVNYNSEEDSWKNGLVYVPSPARDTTIMRVDSWTNLPYGQLRNSVRISSKQKVDIGSIVIADIRNIPFGPSVWGAFWMVGDNWPYGGEIDILEGVHNSNTNQATLHTSPGCTLSTPMQASGNILTTECNAFENWNIGCGVQDPLPTSYGKGWNDNGGGVSVTQWDETGISMWSFLRKDIPADIEAGKPDPSKWGIPTARFDATSCDMTKYFASQSIVFDITLGGDWAGANYKEQGFPGTWQESIMKASNFEQAYFEVGYVKVFKRD